MNTQPAYDLDELNWEWVKQSDPKGFASAQWRKAFYQSWIEKYDALSWLKQWWFAANTEGPLGKGVDAKVMREWAGASLGQHYAMVKKLREG